MNKVLRLLALTAGCMLLLACAAGSMVDTPDRADTIEAADPVAGAPKKTGRARAITSYRDYLARYPDSPERDSITRRLADLLVEQGGDHQAYAEAIELYEYLLHRDPQSTELLYQLSRAYEESGRSEQALESIDRLLATQPEADNRLYSDTRFRQGELLFSEGDYLEAGRAYQAVVDLGVSTPAYEQSLYKLGWSLFKQERYSEALQPLLALLDLKLTPAGAGAQLSSLSAADREQLTDLLRVISGSFAQLEGVDSVHRYFSRVGGRSYELRVYLRLAQWYVEQEQVSEAARTWLYVARRRPLAPEAPRLMARAIDIYRQAGFQQRTVTTQVQFVRDYGMGSEFWSLHSPADFPTVVALLRSSLRDLARLAHEQARRTAAGEDVDEAEQRYREYLAAFGDTATAPEMNYQLAELLYENARYRQALLEYRQTAWLRGPHPRAAEAALGALRASEKILPGAGAQEQAILVEGAAADAQRFVESYPDNPAAPGLLVRTGTGLLERQQYDRALALGRRAVSRAAAETPVIGQLGWSLQAQALFAMDDYPGAAAAYEQALQLTGNEDERRTALQQGLSMSIYRQAGQVLEAGDRDHAVALYQQAALLAPGAAIRSRAEYDAATVLLAQKYWTAAIAALEQFRVDYPDDALQQEVTRRLAYAHESNGDPLRAAREYQAVGEDQRQAESLQREALLRAADLYAQAGEIRQAIAVREGYLDRFPEPSAVAVEVMQQLADLEADRSAAGRRHYWLQALIALDLSEADTRARVVAAEAALELAEHQRIAFRRVQLVNPVQENLVRKIAAMKRALQAFDVAIDYGIAPVTTAATYHVASMYDELGSALLTSERPLDLTAEELAEYELLLAEQAAPFEQQAIDLYTSNTRRADVDQWDPWIEKSAQQLNELRRNR